MHSILLHHRIVSYLDPTGPSYPTTAHLILSMPIPIDSVLEAPAPNPVARVSGRLRHHLREGKEMSRIDFKGAYLALSYCLSSHSRVAVATRSG